MLVSDHLKNALIETGALADGETMSANVGAIGIAVFNRMINAFAADRLFLYQQGRNVFPMTASKASYTLGTGGDLSMARPVYIDRITFLDTTASPTFELPPVKLYTDDEWAEVKLKTLTSPVPRGVYINQDFPLMTLYPWPIPSTTQYSMVIYSPAAQLTSITSLLTSVSYPPGYEEAIHYGLAKRLAKIPGFAPSPRPDLDTEAAAALDRIKAVNVTPIVFGCDDALVARSGSVNWRTGQ